LSTTRIGILGAGQLGRMLALAGRPLGLDFLFLDPVGDACAAPVGRQLRADYDDQPVLTAFADASDVATFEFENVPLSAAALVAGRTRFAPGIAALELGQDRLNEKRAFSRLGIPVPAFATVDSRDDLDRAIADIGLPAVLKTRRMGYDGKGQAVLRSENDIAAAWAALGQQPLILESLVAFTREVSLIAVRAQDGTTAFYPLVENVHRGGILRFSMPRVGDPLQQQAEEHARRVLSDLDYVGVLAFEFFDRDGVLLANEIAPRVHNSGHWTIEGAACSQFENHLRAIAGLPLGETRATSICAMFNLIGESPPLAELLALPGAHPHLYGKSPKPQRKIGHLTVIADSAEELRLRVAAAGARLGEAVPDVI
jgi:5-(carboxyamino)imidazole ribonucleotide synthase